MKQRRLRPVLPIRWKVPREWEGQTAFIVAGGVSVETQDLELIRGRKVIAINSSHQRVPWADILFFGDGRWWRENRKVVENFPGRVVTVTNEAWGEKLLRLKKIRPPGLASDPSQLAMFRTSLTAAINLAAHFGAKRIVLLGADGKATNGRTHHHAPHKWKSRPGCWDEQKLDIVTIVEPLKQLGIEVLNASPGSAWTMWPIVTLEEALDAERNICAAAA